MQAVILVGGEGTRLRPLTLSTPKVMLPIMGVAMLEGVLAHLHRHGVDEAVLSLGYLPDRFIEAFPDGECAGVSLRYAVEPEPLDTAGAVRFAAEELGVTDTFVVVNGDVLTDLDVTSLVAFHRAAGAEGTVALHPVEDPSRFGVVPTDEDGRVIAFVEKPPAGTAPTNEINAGTYVFEPAFLDRVPLGKRVSIERATFPEMVAAGVLFAKSDDGYWLDTGTPEAYLQAHDDLLEGRRAMLITRGRMEGSSYLLPGATIGQGANVDRSVLDTDVTVAADAIVDASVVLPGAVIGRGAEVRGSIVGPGARVGDGAVLEPTTVLGRGVEIEAGRVVHGERVPSS